MQPQSWLHVVAVTLLMEPLLPAPGELRAGQVPPPRDSRSASHRIPSPLPSHARVAPCLAVEGAEAQGMQTAGSLIPVYRASAPEPAPPSMVPCRWGGAEPGPAQWVGPSVSWLCGASRHICQPSSGDTKHGMTPRVEAQGTRNSQAPSRASCSIHHSGFLGWVLGPQALPVQVFVPFDMPAIINSHVKPRAGKGSRWRLGEWAG